MRWVTVTLLVLLALVQAELWLGSGGKHQVHKLQAQLDAQRQRNTEMRQRNERVGAEVDDLRRGLEMVEDRARSELGMIKPDEIFVQLTRR
jgi:cell division protein FtsB